MFYFVGLLMEREQAGQQELLFLQTFKRGFHKHCICIIFLQNVTAVSSRIKGDIFDWLLNIHFSFSPGSGAVHSASSLASEGKSLETNLVPLDCHSHFCPHIQTYHYKQCLPCKASFNLRGIRNAISYYIQAGPRGLLRQDRCLRLGYHGT